MPTDQPTASQIQHVVLDSIPNVQIKGIPSLWQMAISLLTAALLVIGAVLTIGNVVLDKSLEAMEARLNHTITKSAAPITEDMAKLRGVVKTLVVGSTLTQAQKDVSLGDLEPSSVKAALQETQENRDKRSVQSLLNNNQIERTGGVQFKWNDGKSDGQVIYYELKDEKLDLSKIDLYSEGDNDPCSSRVVELPDVSNAVVQICQQHFTEDGRLEFIIIENLF